MSWVCEEFGVGPREALATLGYDPDDMPWDMLMRIGEIRRLGEIHREFERIMSPPSRKTDEADLNRLQEHPLWPAYEDSL